MGWLWYRPDPTPALIGERVLLRAARMADFTAWRALRSESHGFLKPFEPRWSDADLSRTAFAERTVRARREALAGTDFSFLLFATSGRAEQLVGGLTLSNIRRRAAQYANLGYWMGQRFAGQGYMSEAVGVVLPFAFETLRLHRVHAAFLPGNKASRRVLEKNGFAEEGYAEAYLQIDGRWADHVLFGLTRERYEAHRASR